VWGHFKSVFPSFFYLAHHIVLVEHASQSLGLFLILQVAQACVQGLVGKENSRACSKVASALHGIPQCLEMYTKADFFPQKSKKNANGPSTEAYCISFHSHVTMQHD